MVFFDLPGTINNEGVVSTFLNMDYVFVPMSPSRMSMESTLSFIIPVTELIASHKQLSLKSVHLFWNRVDSRVRKEWLEHYAKIIGDFKLSLLDTVIPQSARMTRNSPFRVMMRFSSRPYSHRTNNWSGGAISTS